MKTKKLRISDTLTLINVISIQWSAITLKLMTGEVNNVLILVVPVNYFLGKRTVSS